MSETQEKDQNQENSTDQGSSKEELRTLEGQQFEFIDAASPEDAQKYLELIEEAFSYRGDVTLTFKDGAELLGYVFDRELKVAGNGLEGVIRVMPADGSPRKTIDFKELGGLHFSGKDTAFGKSWDAWVRRFEKLKATGEEASIYGEDLDDAGKKASKQDDAS